MIFSIAFFAAMVWIMYMLLGNPFGFWDWERLAKALPGLVEHVPLERQIEVVLLVVAGALHIWYLRRASRNERLYLDPVGIRYASPLPEFLRRLMPDWSLQWSHIREIRIIAPKATLHAQLVMLEIDAGPIKRRLQAMHWALDGSEGEAPEPMTWRERFFMGFRPARDRERILREVEQSPVVRYAREAGVRITTIDRQIAGAGYALEQHRHALAAAVLVVVLLVYALVDLAVNEEVHAVTPPLVMFVLAGAIVAFAGMIWLASVRVPRAETIGLSLLLGGSVGFALYPGVLRINEATDTEGLRSCEYRLTEYVVFSPVDPDLPILRFPRDADYWGQFELGSTHRFELRRGGLGFYQVNMQPVHARMREYFIGKQ